MSTTLHSESTSSALYRTILSVLFVAWLALLVSAYLEKAGWRLPWPIPWSHSSFALCLAAWAHWLVRRGRPAQLFALGIAVGMTLGFFADWLGGLARILVLFSIAHIAYISAAWNLAGRLGLRNRNVWLVSLGTCILIGTVTWSVTAATAPGIGVYRWPSLAYTILLSATVGTMTAMTIGNCRFTPMAIGALLIFLSDSLLALQLFRGTPWASDVAVWLLYAPGQMLIVFGAVSVSGLAARSTRLAEAVP